MPRAGVSAAEEAAENVRAAQLYEELRSYRKVAEVLDIDHKSVQRRVASARKAGYGIDPAMKAAMDYVGAQGEANLVWVKTKLSKAERDAGGIEYSFQMKPRAPLLEEDPLIERLDAIFSSVPQVYLPKAPALTQPTKRFGLIPINDLHAGMFAWGDETGSGNWDIKIATQRLESWVSQLVDCTPKGISELILLFNGDILHANDHTGMTPKSKHILDTDTRHVQVVDRTAESIIKVTDIAAQAFPHVKLVIKPGNHDPTAYIGLLMAAKWRYYATPQVEVNTQPGEFWAYRRGKTFLFSHHGDKAKPEQLVLNMAAQHPKEWGESEHRYVWTGDKHHRAAKRIGGAMWEQASAMTERDAYAASGAWSNSPEAQSIIYDEDRGEVERHRVCG
jgi:hypothetical protein